MWIHDNHCRETNEQVFSSIGRRHHGDCRGFVRFDRVSPIGRLSRWKLSGSLGWLFVAQLWRIELSRGHVRIARLRSTFAKLHRTRWIGYTFSPFKRIRNPINHCSRENLMKSPILRRYRWGTSLLACLFVAVCAFAGWSLVMPQRTPVTERPQGLVSDPNAIDTKHEPVGWVFGRVVGFEGADKPLLRQTFPTVSDPTSQ